MPGAICRAYILPPPATTMMAGLALLQLRIIRRFLLKFIDVMLGWHRGRQRASLASASLFALLGVIYRNDYRFS